MLYYNRLVIVLLFVGLGLALYFSGITAHFSLANIKQYAILFRLYVQQHYTLSVLAYCAVFIIATLFFIPVTIALTVLGGYLFGVILGLFYALIGATVGSVILFFLVRYIFADMVRRRFADYIALFTVELQTRGYSYLLMLQLLPVTPTPLINITAGLLPLSAWTFAWTAFVGVLPGTLVYVVAGKQLAQLTDFNRIIDWPIIIVLFILALLALLIPYAIRYREK